MKRIHSFTLVELLTVIGIIVVLAGLLMPAINGAMKRAHETACANNLRQLGIAEKGYSTDNQNFIFTGGVDHDANGNWADTLFDYAKDTKVFICPDADEDNSYKAQINGVGNNNSSSDQLSYIANSNVHVTGSARRKKLYDVERASTSVSLGPNTDQGSGAMTTSDGTGAGVSRDRHSGKRANYLMVDGHAEAIDATEIIKSGNHYWNTLN
ncbi:MAG: type II secretion system protein [Victivallales bacterium]|nr:type II secretion system protein [Victivallales bacterium]